MKDRRAVAMGAGDKLPAIRESVNTVFYKVDAVHASPFFGKHIFYFSLAERGTELLRYLPCVLLIVKSTDLLIAPLTL